MQRIKLLEDIRKKIKAEKINAFLIPSNDPHQSEYVASCWKSIDWISGFTGSAANIVITQDHAGLWTDSRYFIQAEDELAGGSVQLHKLLVPHTAEHIEWLIKKLNKGDTIGLEGDLYSRAKIKTMQAFFNEAGINVKICNNFLDSVWFDRPPLPQSQIFSLDVKFTGLSRKAKIDNICDKLSEGENAHFFISSLDDIAWIFNLRGSDVDYNPVFLAYALISREKTSLFLDKSKLKAGLEAELKTDNIEIQAYESIDSAIKNLSKKVAFDPNTTSIKHFNLINQGLANEITSYSSQMKGVKNATEISNTRKAMINDGVALTSLYMWLEENHKNGVAVSEVDVAKKLAGFRAEQEYYFGESFGAIVGFKGNGAIVHYHPEPKTCAQIDGEGMLLLDSGGQYYTGTTDITRTTYFGNPTSEHKVAYTAVLKGNIAIDQLRFPKGTKGYQVEVLARQFLWNQGLNYGHGTGHGVGYFLNVHEGPQSISSVAGGKSSTALKVGMITSNEPGFYKTNEFGIRIENLILVVNDRKTPSGEFLKFETLTLFPIATNLIDFGTLSKTDVEWINAYHKKVNNTLAPHLNDSQKQWMANMCKPV